MSDAYEQIRFAMNLTTKSINGVVELIDSMYDLHPHSIYNTITTSELSEKEKQLAFFIWGVNVGLNIQDDSKEE